MTKRQQSIKENLENSIIRQPWKFKDRLLKSGQNFRGKQPRLQDFGLNQKPRTIQRESKVEKSTKRSESYARHKFGSWTNFIWDVDPGSGCTLAACLTHASRTKHLDQILSGWRTLWLSGGRVSNAWVTCPVQGDNSWKRLLIPHKPTEAHDWAGKTPVVQDGPASD